MWLITQLRANIPRCAVKIQIFSQTNVKMLRLFLYLQQFNVFLAAFPLYYSLTTTGTTENNILLTSGLLPPCKLSQVVPKEEKTCHITNPSTLHYLTLYLLDGTAQFAAQSGTVVVAKIGKESVKIAIKKQ